MQLRLLKVPKFKADFLRQGKVGTQNVKIRREERDTSQRQEWLKKLASDVEGNAATKLAAKPGGVPKPKTGQSTGTTDDGGKGDPNRVFFYRIGNSQNLLIGTPAELKSEFVIPRWDKSGQPRAMDIDHKEEWQLGGEDELYNIQVLD